MSEERFATEEDRDLSPSARTRRLVAALVLGIHVIVVLGLIRAFAPDFAANVSGTVLSTFTVTVSTPPPPAQPPPASNAKPAAAAAEIGRKAQPRPVAAPPPRIALATPPAAPVPGKGSESAAGAAIAGQGTGAGGQGSGTGAGSGGNGQGGGAAGKAVKISGDINSARDYPKESRDARIGDSVTVVLTVGTDGRVKRCRIHKPSRDPQSDAITCRLASERFRFRPATDDSGNPVESVFGWQQRWFYPGGND